MTQKQNKMTTEEIIRELESWIQATKHKYDEDTVEDAVTRWKNR